MVMGVRNDPKLNRLPIKSAKPTALQQPLANNGAIHTLLQIVSLGPRNMKSMSQGSLVGFAGVNLLANARLHPYVAHLQRHESSDRPG